MKPIFCIMICLTLFLCFAACSEKSPSNAGLPNPLVEYDNPDFMDAAGFKIAAYPDNDPERFALIAEQVGEMDITLGESGTATFRVAVDTNEDISGVYDTFNQTVTGDIDGVTVETNYTSGGPMLSKWTKNGYAFSLFVAESDLSQERFTALTQDYVQGIVMEPETAPPAKPAR